MTDLRPGDLLKIGKDASVQFAARPILFRVIRVLPQPTYEGWVWLDGYEIGPDGAATDRRQIFVQRLGIQFGREMAGRPRNSGTFSGGRTPAPRPSTGRVSPSTRTHRTRS